MSAKTLLKISGVSKSFPGVYALRDVTFDVIAGEVHGLVGENGAGKSTLMGVASGALVPNSGTVVINGIGTSGDPQAARELGLAIVRQEPALMPDLTVAENLYLGVSASRRPPMSEVHAWALASLQKWNRDITISPSDRVDTLVPESRFIVEIVKALANEPAVLVLDEPTEHLTAEDVERLFAQIHTVTARGACVIYISHRIREVQRIAHRLTVLRDGESQGTYDAKALSEDRIVELIVGTSLDREFPRKTARFGAEVLKVQGYSGPGFSNINLSVRAGEILGLAGISDNGQHEFMRALAGLLPSTGQVSLQGVPARIQSGHAALSHGIAYLPGDRHREGIFADLSVRENFSIRSIGQGAVGPLVIPAQEARRAADAVAGFAIKTPSVDTPIRSLSGGNQQKVVLSSVLASGPKLLLVDEPSQGVDVGARMEIYRQLREAADQGVAIIALSTDAAEVAGLSDRVAIFSRGQVVETLEGRKVSEAEILSSVLKSTSVREKVHGSASAFWRWAAGQVGPLVLVSLAILLMGGVAAWHNPAYLTTQNINGMMTLIATAALVAYGQQLLMLVGGIDLSVGPLLGLQMVVASFWLVADGGTGQTAQGYALLLLVAVVLGLLNWILVEPVRLHPMVATLATYMGVQAVALLYRPTTDGPIDDQVMEQLGHQFGFVPSAFLAAVALGFLLEFVLLRSRLGYALRGLGSREESARVAGVVPSRMRLLAYVGCSVLTMLAALTLIPQVGIGDPRAGIGFTLTSIAAVVIGGASLFGGRGSFIGSLLGAIFITQVNTVTNFLGLDQAWQSYLLGGMIVAAVAIFSKSRQLAAAT
jgi:ribose transport system ATP-binding protein